MPRALAIVVLLVYATVVGAAVTIKGSANYALHEPIVLKAEGKSASAQYLWDVEGEGAKVVESAGVCYVWAPAGKYTVRLTAIDFDNKKVERTRFNFTVGKGPTPDPDPPTPDPDPPVPPTPTGMRVLILYESSELSKLPGPQNTVLYAKSVRDYLNAKCASGPKMKEWRIWDKDADVSKQEKHWQELVKRPAKSYPWIVIQAKTTYEGPLPKNTEETLNLLRKYGG